MFRSKEMVFRVLFFAVTKILHSALRFTFWKTFVALKNVNPLTINNLTFCFGKLRKFYASPSFPFHEQHLACSQSAHYAEKCTTRTRCASLKLHHDEAQNPLTFFSPIFLILLSFFPLYRPFPTKATCNFVVSDLRNI